MTELRIAAIVLSLLALVVMYGLVYPPMVSAANTVTVVTGLLLALFTGPVLVYLLLKFLSKKEQKTDE